MNPFSLIFIGLGLILIYVGWKGSQKNVFATFLGRSGTTAKTASSNSGSTSSTSSQATNASTGNNGAGVKPTA